MISSSDGLTKVCMFDCIKEVVCVYHPRPDYKTAFVRSLNTYIQPVLEGIQECMGNRFRQYISGQFAPQNITEEVKHLLRNCVVNSDIAESHQGLLKQLNQKACQNANPTCLQGETMCVANNLFGHAEHKIKGKNKRKKISQGF